jgi:hypothetical protein
MTGNLSDSQPLKGYHRFARVGYIHNLSNCFYYQLKPIFPKIDLATPQASQINYNATEDYSHIPTPIKEMLFS